MQKHSKSSSKKRVKETKKKRASKIETLSSFWFDKKFGKLSVLGILEGGTEALVLCDCGNTTVCHRPSLRRGGTRSCGCIRQGNKFNYPAEYRIWSAMRTRCTNKNMQQYADYGGRGITICERWSKFEGFLEDMGERPEGLTLDRIDNNAGYSKENCRWATMSEQASNNRRNIRLTYKGETRIALEWAKILGMNPGTIYSRVGKGWPVEKVLTPDLMRRKKRPST